MLTTRLRYFSLVVAQISLLASACGPVATATPTTLPTERPTLTPTPAPTLTPTPVALTSDEKQATFTAYKTMLLGELAARVTLETADRLLSGEDVGLAPLGWIIAAAATAKAADDEMAKITPPAILQADFDEARAASAQTLDVLARWVDKQIDAKTVQTEMKPIVERHQAAIESAAAHLTQYYGWDAAALAQTRQDLLDRIPTLFATATPTP